MALLPPLKLSEQEKLEALQRLDRFRNWRSLDEKRYCLVCSTIITGREIHIIGGTRGTGPLRVICLPTAACITPPETLVAPPGTGPLLSTVTRAPCLDASRAARNPAPPAPMISTSDSRISTSISPLSGTASQFPGPAFA